MEIKKLPNWVVWKSEPNKSGIATKVPFCPQSGNRAKSNDPTTWSTFDQAQQAATNGYSGVGFMFSPAANVTGIDLDNCIDESNELSDLALAVVGKMRTYTEISPSGRGLHVLACGQIPNAIKRPEIEIYSQGRYFTWTGRHLNGTPEAIEDRQIELSELYDQYTNKTQEEGSELPKENPILITSDEDIISLARQAANGAKFDRLFRGDTSDFGNDHSLADLSLCRILSFYCQKDMHQVDRIFRQSGLMRPKWDSIHRASDKATYGQMTIEKAAGAQVDSYEPAQDHLADFELTPDDTEQFLLAAGADDEGNAQCLVALYPDKFLHCPQYGWLYYNGKYWQMEDAEPMLDRHIVAMIKRRKDAAQTKVKQIYLQMVDEEKKKKGDKLKTFEAIRDFCKRSRFPLNGCKTLLRSLVHVNVAEFDDNPDAINCNNGWVNLRAGDLTPHSAEQRFTYCISTDYVPESNYFKWENWLWGTIKADSMTDEETTEVIDYIQRSIGYSLTGLTSEECLFYLSGKTRAGKGTFTETILKMLGAPRSTIATEVDFVTFSAKRDHDSNNFDLAGLKATRLIAASETNRQQSLNPARIKAVTGGNGIRASFKHKNFFTYWPEFKLWLSSNFPIKADAEDDALWGRVNVIVFPHSYLGCENKSLKREMLETENLKAVLAWAIEGAQKWYESLPKGLEKPLSIIRDTQAQKDDNDITKAFLKDKTTEIKDTKENDKNWILWSTFYQNYKEWCKEYGHKPKASKNLSSSLRHKGYRIEKTTVNNVPATRIYGLEWTI